LGDSRVLPGRAAIEARRIGYLVHGGPTKADVWVADLPGRGRVVVKDFARKSWPVRFWGWLQVARESKFLGLLEDLGATPRLAGRLDRFAVVMDFIEGSRLFEHPGPAARPHLEHLRQVLDAVQARGVVHNDLRGRENVLLLADGRGVVVLDWASALRLPPGSLRHRILFGALRSVDDSAFLKWKDMLDPGSLTLEDREAMRRFRRWRRLWPFNRKGVGWTRVGL
jgi:hypothetical protein